jgi:hypothetical protein
MTRGASMGFPGIIVELVKIGFLGFSVVILYFSFKLLTSLVNNNTEQPIAQFRHKVFAIVAFLVLSVLVMGSGLYWSYADPGRQIMVNVEKVPSDREQFATIILKVTNQDYPFTDRKEIPIRNNERVTIYLHELDNFIDDLEEALERSKEENLGLIEQVDTVTRELIPPPTASNEEGGI